ARQVAERLARIGVGDDGAERQPHGDVVAILAGAIVAAPGATALRAIAQRLAAIEQGANVRIHTQPHVAATAAVAAVGAALRHVLRAPEADAAGAALPGSDLDLGVVNEHGGVWCS